MKCRTRQAIVSILLVHQVAATWGLRPASNLDFGDFGEHKPPLLERRYVQEHQLQANKRTAENSDKISVICASDGCNTTQSDGGGGGKEPIADVVVQVKATLNTNEAAGDKNPASSTQDEQVPDVPIVLGYGGVTNAPSSFVDVQPPLVGNAGDFHEPRPHVRNGNGFQPSLGLGVINIQFKPLLPVDNAGRYPNTYTKYNTWNGNWNYQQNPVPWYRREYGRPTQSPLSGWTPCRCHPNSVWPQTTPSYVALNHPGKQINDKLEPLN